MFVRQVADDHLSVPGNVLMTYLTRVPDILVNGNTQPRGLTCPCLLLGNILVIVFIQAQVMSTDVTLKFKRYYNNLLSYRIVHLNRALVKKYFFAAHQAFVKLLLDKISWG